MEIKKENYVTVNENNVIETISLEDLQRAVENMVYNVKLNNKCPCEVPVYFKSNGKTYEFSKWALGLACGKEFQVHVEFDDYRSVTYVAPDSRPEEGEYWRSRGIGGTDKNPDCSGFVVSKLAGERLRRMVRLVLEKDETETWLDFRESEPNWIQFKFSGHEFDLEKLEKLAEKKGNVVTLEILKQCKK
jgi:hypothetical protein